MKKYLSKIGIIISLAATCSISHASNENSRLIPAGINDVTGASSVLEASAKTDKPVQVIVRLSEGALDGDLSKPKIRPASLNSSKASLRAARATFKNKFGQRLKDKKLNKKHSPTFREIDDSPYIVTSVTYDQLEVMIESGEVAEVFEDRPSYLHLSASVPAAGVTPAHSAGRKGAGQTIAILDTGVQTNHPMLANKIVTEACYSTNSSSQGTSSLCPNGQSSMQGTNAAAACTHNSACAHGTHVAGIAAGKATGSFPNGVAPEANILPINVFSNCPNGLCSYTSDQLAALTLVKSLRNTHNISAVNMSLGSNTLNTSACSSNALTAIIQELRNAGTAVVISSGNNSFTSGVGSPACVPGATAVAAVNNSGAFADFSNVSSLVKILAPGSNILSAVPGNGLASMSGTSMAAPHVAGAFALLKSISPSASVSQLETALIKGGVATSVTGTSLILPRLNAVNSVQHLPPVKTKIAEVGDPTTGTTPGCTITQTYSTGQGSMLVNIFTVACPGHSVSVEKRSWSNTNTCQFLTSTPGYTVEMQSCSNYRIYQSVVPSL